MPFRPENRDRYPDNWSEISRQIREAANNTCEKCGTMNGANIRRGKTAEGTPVWRPASWPVNLDGMSSETGETVIGSCGDLVNYGDPVRVVLTVAHLDHQPENCDPENLRAWCQRCHNIYDGPMRRAGIASRRHAARACGDLFNG